MKTKRVIPPKHYHGPRPEGERFQRFEEMDGRVVGLTHDGRRFVIPQAPYWREDAERI